MTPLQYQETISLDVTLDRLLNRLNIETDINCYQYEYLVHIIDNIFSLPHILSKEYVDNRLLKLKNYREQLEKLKQLPTIEQRTQIWYDTRNTLITASDFAQALNEGKFGNQKQFIIKKTGYEKDEFNGDLPPLKWGVMFEHVATKIYESRYNVKINEFGLIKHKEYDFFGASPDGITNNGIMVEIKCPFKRKINGEIPLQYYYQIQGQLDVCDLEECDYFECEFTEYKSELEFYSDDNNIEKGVIVEYKNEEDETKYMYSEISYNLPDKISIKEFININNNINIKDKKIHYYKLNKLNTQRVYRNKEFIEEKIPELKVIWEKILNLRNNKELYDSEFPAKKKKTTAYLFLD